MKGGLNSISSLQNYHHNSQLFLVYQALVESYLRYGNQVWGHLPEKTLLISEDTEQGIFPH